MTRKLKTRKVGEGKALVLRNLCAVICLLALVLSLSPMPNSFADEGVVVRPFDPEALKEAREDLLELMQKAVVQKNVKQALAKELRGAFDGTPSMAIRIHLLELMAIGDEADLLPLIAKSIAELRWHIKLDQKLKAGRAKAGSVSAEKTQAEIEKLGCLGC